MSGTPRMRYISLALLTIAAGLMIHLHGPVKDPVARDMLGDALWAAMIVWIVSAIAPRASLLFRAAVAYAFCMVIEISQRYHYSWLDAIRATAAGHLVLGSGFDPRDFAAYALGVAFAAVLDRALVRRGG